MISGMGGIRRIQIFGLLVATTFFGFAVSVAGAASIMADPTCCTFTGGPFIQAPGERSTFEIPANAAPHNVTASAFGPDKGPLFIADTIFGGETADVAGTEYLVAGTYPFVCTLHPGMNGELLVEGDGSPLARPSVRVSIAGQKLNKVKKSGKVKVVLKAKTLSNGVTVRLLKGKKNLSGPVKVNLKAGSSRTVAIKLNGAGKKAVRKVKKGRKFQVSVTGNVPFGKPARAARAIR